MVKRKQQAERKVQTLDRICHCQPLLDRALSSINYN